MQHSEFHIGGHFVMGGRLWRCTDVGTRTVVAICLDDAEIVSYNSGTHSTSTQPLTRQQAHDMGWFNGPPYAVVEQVLDENDFPACEAIDSNDTAAR